MIKVHIVQGDTAQVIEDTLMIGTDPISLVGCSVHLVFKRNGEIVERVATVVAEELGKVRYQLQDDDVTNDALLRWKITYSDSSTLHFPQNEWVFLKIQKL